MAERKYDRSLHIRTIGLRENSNQTEHNRYEATPYAALDEFFQVYRLDKTDRVVDFGCGRGRTMFYIHNRFHIPVTGIEGNDKTFDEAVNNKASYRSRAKHISAPVRLEYGLAEHYDVGLNDNKFYFFNPFSVQIFKKVVHNILRSVEEQKRAVEIILYYPLPEFKQFLATKTPFKKLNKIKVPGIHGKYGKFLIYRFS